MGDPRGKAAAANIHGFDGAAAIRLFYFRKGFAK
jgi:hypothetical protein